jgi:exopolysaccharide production protein ExoZ
MMQTKPRPRVESLQILRALAATLVLFSHSAREVAPLVSETLPGFALQKGGQFGVDVFFVISGFIMVYVTMGNPKSQPTAGNFLIRRGIRVIPLYWIFTTLTVVMSFMAGGSKNHSDTGWKYILSSYLFWPARRSDGHVTPALGVGWTLNFEMFFYVVFALGILAFGRNAWRGAAIALASLVIFGMFLPHEYSPVWYFTRPILLEFLAGIVLALVFLSGRRLHWALALAMSGAGWVWWYLGTSVPDPADTYMRVVMWGVPAMLIVFGFMLSSVPVDSLLPGPLRRLLVKVGDCSYSTYLIHMFVVRTGMIVIDRVAPGLRAYEVVCVLLLATVATAVAYVCHLFLEKPLTAALDRRFAPVR